MGDSVVLEEGFEGLFNGRDLTGLGLPAFLRGRQAGRRSRAGRPQFTGAADRDGAGRVFYYRTSWEKDALAFAFKAGGLVVAILALGIGANTAIFGVVNAVLLRSLPYDEPASLLTLFADGSARGQGGRLPVTAGDYAWWRERATVFTDVAALRNESRPHHQYRDTFGSASARGQRELLRCSGFETGTWARFSGRQAGRKGAQVHP